MRGALLIAWLLGSGCLRSTAFQCDNDVACGNGGVCETSGYCSFIDSECSSGRRYGDSAGPSAGQCTASAGGVDGGMGSDAQPIDGSAVGNCPSGYNLVSGAGSHVYKVLTVIEDWGTQQTTCRASSTSSNLFMPDDLAELQAINALATVPALYWIGVEDPAEGTYVNVLGAPQTFLPWDTMQPDDGPPSEDCVEGIKATNKINDERCNTKLPAVCECAP